MTVRLRYSLAASVSSTSAEAKDLGNVKFEVVSDSDTKGGTWKTVVAQSTTDAQLAMDNITSVQFILIRTQTSDPNDDPVQLTFKKNSAMGEAIIVKPVDGSTEGLLALTTTGLTALYVTNAGSVDMVVTLTVVGT